MDEELLKCIKCNWVGYYAVLKVCSDCKEIYYHCPICDSRVFSIREKPFLFYKVHAN